MINSSGWISGGPLFSSWTFNLRRLRFFLRSSVPEDDESSAAGEPGALEEADIPSKESGRLSSTSFFLIKPKKKEKSKRKGFSSVFSLSSLSGFDLLEYISIPKYFHLSPMISARLKAARCYG